MFRIAEKQKKWLCLLGIPSRSGDTGSLRERFCKDYARHERISGKMPGEDWIAVSKYCNAFR